MTSTVDMPGVHQLVPEDDRIILEESAVDPAGPATTGDPGLADLAAPEHPAATDSGGVAAEPGAAGTDPGRPSEVLAPAAEPGPSRAASVASGSTSPGADWHEILAMFVDDPRSCLEMAARLVRQGTPECAAVSLAGR
jgi:hypothetical protein